MQRQEPGATTTFRSDKVFSGPIPEIYETYLVPLIFEYYAKDLAHRVAAEPVTRVLEVAAGTDVVTRSLVDALGPGVSITATDMNPSMLDYGASIRVDENVDWQQADALELPFGDATFDKAGGFTATPEVDTIAARSKASSPSIPAVAYCQGTPLRNEIEHRDASLLGHATGVAAAALSARFGDGAVDGKIQAHVVTVRA